MVALPHPRRTEAVGTLLRPVRHRCRIRRLLSRNQLAWDAVTLVNALIGLAVLLAATVALGVFVQWRQGRPRRHIPHEVVQPGRLGAESLGQSATLLQFSTELCSRCPGVHRTLAAVADGRDGVRHLDIDVTHRPDIAKHFHILQTPTTLVLDADGVVQTRFGGVPNRDVLELELNRLTGEAANV
jgi:thiol-disulfide isomerase/thioredoxin